MVNKTVYILGAGASAAAQIPIQNQLLEKIFSITLTDIPCSTSILDNDSTSYLTTHFSGFETSRRYLSDFLIYQYDEFKHLEEYQNYKKYKYYHDNSSLEDFFKDTNNQELNDFWEKNYKILLNYQISLEDVFTSLDKAILNNDYYGIYTPEALNLISTCLKNCIIYILSLFENKQKHSNTLYKKIADKLVNDRLKTAQKDDPFSIITMNWDTLLDYYIKQSCENHNKTIPSNAPHIYPDYCFYNYDLQKYTPSVLVKGSGNYNIKILKLHGSINWLECPNCSRIYTHSDDEISLSSIRFPDSFELSDDTCKSCLSMNRKSFGRPIIITPTYLKSFNSYALKNIWQNAYLELSEATELIFIGYSFPYADFELKYILKKAINSSCNIKVILHANDDKLKYIKQIYNLFNINLSDQNKYKNEIFEIFENMSFPEKRYREFFTQNKINFSYDGIESLFK